MGQGWDRASTLRGLSIIRQHDHPSKEARTAAERIGNASAHPRQ
jgi:hypothetical protein